MTLVQTLRHLPKGMNSAGVRYTSHLLPAPSMLEPEKIRRERELSSETNRRRKALADRKQHLMLLEEERIRAAIAQRKEIQRYVAMRYSARSASFSRYESYNRPIRADAPIGDRMAMSANFTATRQGANIITPRLDVASNDRVVTPSRSNLYTYTNGGSLHRSASADSSNLHNRLMHDTVRNSLASAANQLTSYYRTTGFAESNRRVRSASLAPSQSATVSAEDAKIVSDGSINEPQNDRFLEPDDRLADRGRAPVRSFEDQARSLQDELAQMTLSDRAPLGSLRQTVDVPVAKGNAEVGLQDTADTVAQPANATLGRNESADAIDVANSNNRELAVLLALRRRGSMNELRANVDKRSIGFASGRNERTVRIRGILKRSSSVDNLLRFPTLGVPSDSAVSTNGSRVFENSADENVYTKKSVRFAEKNEFALPEAESSPRGRVDLAYRLRTQSSNNAFPSATKVTVPLRSAELRRGETNYGGGRASNDVEIDALWATVRDYLDHSSAPATEPADAAVTMSPSSRSNQAAVSDDSTAAVQPIHAERTFEMQHSALNAAHDARQVRPMKLGPTLDYSSASTLQSPHIWPYLMHPNFTSSARRKPANANDKKPQRVNAQQFLQAELSNL